MKQDINVLISEYKRTGCTKALEGILNLVKPLIIKTVYSLHIDSYTREDLVQQGYLIAIDSIKTYDQSRNTLYYIYLKKCLLYSFYKMLKVREIPCLNEPMGDGLEFIDTVKDIGLCVEDEVIVREVKSALYKAIDSLPNMQRHVIVERFFNNKELPEIVSNMRIDYTAVVNKQRRALKNLRKSLAGVR